MLFHKKLPEAQFAEWSFLCLIVLFAAIANHKLAIGLSGLGTVLVLAALLVEANKDRIWEDYKRHYKEGKSNTLPQSWTQTNKLYYQLNVYVVWPLVFFLGLAAIYAAYTLG